MDAAALTSELRSAAPALAGRLRAGILIPLATLIARAFLRNPARVGIIVLLWGRLHRAARRFDRLMARVVQGTEQPCPPRPGRQRTPAAACPALPAPYAWLLKDLKHEAAVFTQRLESLLSSPANAAIIAHCPQAQRLVRPLCHMLGVRHAALPPSPSRRRTTRATRAPAAPPTPPTRVAPRYVTYVPPRAAFRWPPPPLSETAPCPHVFWPWFPRTTQTAT